LIVYPRPGFEIKQATVYPNTTFISAPLIDISATEIREKLKKHESVTGMVPDQVANYLLLKNIL
jgi:nicotinate-nucleotide adenylyltransferase